MKSRDIIITVVVVILIGWLVVRHFTQEDTGTVTPAIPSTTTKSLTK